MAFQPVPDTAKVAVVYNRGITPMVNVFHFTRSGQWGLPELQQLMEAVGTAVVNDILIHMSANVALFRLEGRGLRAAQDVSSVHVLAPPPSGGRPGDLTPGNVAFCVTHLTGLSGRAARGRTFFGGLSEEDVASDHIQQARANGLRDGLVSVRNAASTAGWTMVVVNRKRDKVLLNPAETIPVIGFRYADLVLDSQRRRLLGRGM